MTEDEYSFHFLIHGAHLLEERLREGLERHSVRPRQARILDALDRMGEVSQADLAAEFAVSAASMSTMTSRLLKSGLIERKTDPQELRRNLLSLTKSGRSKLKSVYQVWGEIEQDIIQILGAEKAQHLAALSRELRNLLGGSTPGRE
ncbi:MAG: MarR family transcriptional regulator [Planctomycetota bacterium]|nr:MarR family transcriptional regulator [Planctomycetota bacterium]